MIKLCTILRYPTDGRLFYSDYSKQEAGNRDYTEMKNFHNLKRKNHIVFH